MGFCKVSGRGGPESPGNQLRAGEAGGFDAGALDVGEGLGGAGCQDFVAGFGDQHVVLDADADAAEG